MMIFALLYNAANLISLYAAAFILWLTGAVR